MSNPAEVFDAFIHLDINKNKVYRDVFIVDFYDLYRHDAEFANWILENHTWLDEHKQQFGYKDIILVNLIMSTPIRDIKSKITGTLIQVEGVVVQRSNPMLRATTVTFECQKCESHIKVRQKGQYRRDPLDECVECEGRKWSRVYGESEFIDYQEIVIEELMDNTLNGGSPDKIKVVLIEELIRSCEPGEQVVVVGYLDAYDDSYSSKTLDLQYHIHAHSIVNTTDSHLILLTEEDKQWIQEQMQSEDHFQKITSSIAPSIYGLEEVKKALALQQCEGQVRVVNSTRTRGQFHILLAGPPGLGKSVLGDFMVKCHPKGRKAIGKGASGVGLTASVVKDGEQFVLRAGAMPRADNGFLFIDEIEKMSQNDSGAMHPGMEQQVINIDKADISAELKTRCSILAACNPLGGTWDDYKTTVGNLNEKGRGLARPLLDRFALIFIIKQNLKTDVERDVINHIIKPNENDAERYSIEELHKIFAYARTIEVSMTERVGERLKEFYMVLYEASKQDSALIVSRRQIQDLIRLSEASARLHGRSETTLVDAENAIKIVATSLQQYGIDPETGRIDQNKALYGRPQSKSSMIGQIPGVISRIASRNIDKTKVSRVAFIQYATELWGLSESEAGDLLTVALRDGLIFSPTPAMLSVAT